MLMKRKNNRKKLLIALTAIISSALLTGCSPAAGHFHNFISFFTRVLDHAQEERKHDCSITVKDAEGRILYTSKEQDVIDFFANIVTQISEVSLETPAHGELLYEYIARDNENQVSFYLYEPGDVLSFGYGGISVCLRIPEDTGALLAAPEEWMMESST